MFTLSISFPWTAKSEREYKYRNNVFALFKNSYSSPLHCYSLFHFSSLTLQARKVNYIIISSIVTEKSSKIKFNLLIHWFRCRGSAVNYLISITSHQGCLDACNRDDRCSYYSHLRSVASHPDHNTCYLFTSENCDMEDLMLDECRCRYSQWRTGRRTTFSHKYNNLLSGDSDVILSYIRNYPF